MTWSASSTLSRRCPAKDACGGERGEKEGKGVVWWLADGRIPLARPTYPLGPTPLPGAVIASAFAEF